MLRVLSFESADWTDAIHNQNVISFQPVIFLTVRRGNIQEVVQVSIFYFPNYAALLAF